MGSNAKIAEVQETYRLPFKTTEDAVEGVTKVFGMSVCDKSNQVNVTEKFHNLLLSGSFFGKEMVLIRAIIGFNSEYGCVMKACIRSLNPRVSSIVSECVQ